VSVVDENKIAHISGGSGISEGRVNELIDIKVNELDFASEGDIAQAISELDIPHYSAGENITISSEGVISATGGGSGGGLDSEGVRNLIKEDFGLMAPSSIIYRSLNRYSDIPFWDQSWKPDIISGVVDNPGDLPMELKLKFNNIFVDSGSAYVPEEYLTDVTFNFVECGGDQYDAQWYAKYSVTLEIHLKKGGDGSCDFIFIFLGYENAPTKLYVTETEDYVGEAMYDYSAIGLLKDEYLVNYQRKFVNTDSRGEDIRLTQLYNGIIINDYDDKYGDGPIIKTINDVINVTDSTADVPSLVIYELCPIMAHTYDGYLKVQNLWKRPLFIRFNTDSDITKDATTSQPYKVEPVYVYYTLAGNVYEDGSTLMCNVCSYVNGQIRIQIEYLCGNREYNYVSHQVIRDF
jgi:hypothetical protein